MKRINRLNLFCLLVTTWLFTLLIQTMLVYAFDDSLSEEAFTPPDNSVNFENRLDVGGAVSFAPVPLDNPPLLPEYNSLSVSAFGPSFESQVVQNTALLTAGAVNNTDIPMPITSTTIIKIASETPWQDMTSQQQGFFYSLFSEGDNIPLIPTNFAADSAFAYALGLGNIGPTGAGSDGVGYDLINGRWQRSIRDR